MKNILITGGSSGIGLEISKRFAAHGYTLLWVCLLEEEARSARESMQKEYPNTEVHYFIQDLSNSEGAQNVLDWSITVGEVSVLVNNAGIGTYGFSTDISIDQEVKMIHLNVLTLYKLTRLFLNKMKAVDNGTIINISSSSSYQPVPKMAAYGATKSFVSHYSQALQSELRDQGSKVKVITILPSAIKDTPFKKTANMENVKTFESFTTCTRAEVADDIWKAFQNGSTYMRSGKKYRAAYWLTKILPHSVVATIIKSELSEKK